MFEHVTAVNISMSFHLSKFEQAGGNTVDVDEDHHKSFCHSSLFSFFILDKSFNNQK